MKTQYNPYRYDWHQFLVPGKLYRFAGTSEPTMVMMFVEFQATFCAHGIETKWLIGDSEFSTHTVDYNRHPEDIYTRLS